MKFLANIGYSRNTAIGAWKRLGRLFYDPDKESAALFLYGFRFGLLGAKPAAADPPFLQGDLIKTVDTGRNELIELYIGFISTAHTEEGEPIYSIILECMPMVNLQRPSSIWIPIRLETNMSYKGHDDAVKATKEKE